MSQLRTNMSQDGIELNRSRRIVGIVVEWFNNDNRVKERIVAQRSSQKSPSARVTSRKTIMRRIQMAIMAAGLGAAIQAHGNLVVNGGFAPSGPFSPPNTLYYLVGPGDSTT